MLWLFGDFFLCYHLHSKRGQSETFKFTGEALGRRGMSITICWNRPDWRNTSHVASLQEMDWRQFLGHHFFSCQFSCLIFIFFSSELFVFYFSPPPNEIEMEWTRELPCRGRVWLHQSLSGNGLFMAGNVRRATGANSIVQDLWLSERSIQYVLVQIMLFRCQTEVFLELKSNMVRFRARHDRWIAIWLSAYRDIVDGRAPNQHARFLSFDRWIDGITRYFFLFAPGQGQPFSSRRENATKRRGKPPVYIETNGSLHALVFIDVTTDDEREDPLCVFCAVRATALYIFCVAYNSSYRNRISRADFFRVFRQQPFIFYHRIYSIRLVELLSIDDYLAFAYPSS